jgi:hypothetical protein
VKTGTDGEGPTSWPNLSPCCASGWGAVHWKRRSRVLFTAVLIGYYFGRVIIALGRVTSTHMWLFDRPKTVKFGGSTERITLHFVGSNPARVFVFIMKNIAVSTSQNFRNANFEAADIPVRESISREESQQNRGKLFFCRGRFFFCWRAVLSSAKKRSATTTTTPTHNFTDQKIWPIKRECDHSKQKSVHFFCSEDVLNGKVHPSQYCSSDYIYESQGEQLGRKRQMC